MNMTKGATKSFALAVSLWHIVYSCWQCYLDVTLLIIEELGKHKYLPVMPSCGNIFILGQDISIWSLRYFAQNRGLHILSENPAPILGQCRPETPPIYPKFSKISQKCYFHVVKKYFLGKVKWLYHSRKKNKYLCSPPALDRVKGRVNSIYSFWVKYPYFLNYFEKITVFSHEF